MTDHKADLSAGVKPGGELERAAKLKVAKAEPKTVYLYIGHNEAGEWDTFSDELEASRYALKGASKARVEKRELRKRQK